MQIIKLPFHTIYLGSFKKKSDNLLNILRNSFSLSNLHLKFSSSYDFGNLKKKKLRDVSKFL
jgi:hypothetical protein